MATLSEDGRIKSHEVADEISRLRYFWEQDISHTIEKPTEDIRLEDFLTQDAIDELDHLEKVELKEIIKVCLKSRSGAEAARTLYDKSRLKKANPNDSHRMKTTLERFGLSFEGLKGV